MRSIMSFVAEYYFRAIGYKKMVSDSKRCAEYIEKCRKISQMPYNLPEKLKMSSSIEKHIIDDEEVFFINRRDAQQKKIFYFHGGGYVEQPVSQHWTFLDKIALKTDATIIAPVYPKAPDHTYKETFDKLLILYARFLPEVSPSEIIFMGDSAGGGIALAFAQLLREKKKPQPAEIIALSPWVDITMENTEMLSIDKKDPTLSIYGLTQMGKAWAGNASRKNYLVSPLYGNLHGIAGITVFAGGHEILKYDIRMFVEKAKESGATVTYIEHPKMNHVFPLYPIPEAVTAQKKIIETIRERFSHHKR